MKKVSDTPVRTHSALNLAILRGYLGGGERPLSQAKMAEALGASGQDSYKEYEAKTPVPQKLKDRLHEAGVNIVWLETGAGQMLRPGVERIVVVRDEKGKPTGLRAILSSASAVLESSPLEALDLIEEAVEALAVRGIQPSTAEGHQKLRKLLRDALEAGRGSSEPLVDRVERWIRAAEAIRK